MDTLRRDAAWFARTGTPGVVAARGEGAPGAADRLQMAVPGDSGGPNQRGALVGVDR